MVFIRPMVEHEAGLVRDLWLRMCEEAGTPLADPAPRLILTNLRHYAAHPQVRCFVALEEQTPIGFLTCVVLGHPVMPGLSGEIEELYVRPGVDCPTIQAELVRQAVLFLQAQGAGSVHVRMCTGKECPDEAAQRAFWQGLGWGNDMTIYSIYSNVPGDPELQRTWDAYQAQP